MLAAVEHPGLFWVMLTHSQCKSEQDRGNPNKQALAAALFVGNEKHFNPLIWLLARSLWLAEKKSPTHVVSSTKTNSYRRTSMTDDELRLLREIERPGSQNDLPEGEELQKLLEGLVQEQLISRSYGQADTLTDKGHEALAKAGRIK